MVDTYITQGNLEGVSFVKFIISREKGLEVLENYCFRDDGVTSAIVNFVPNGDPPLGSIKVSTDGSFLYFSLIKKINGLKGGIIYRIHKESASTVNSIIESIFRINPSRVPKWRYQIRFLKGLQYLLSTILTGGKVIIIGEQLEIILFLISLSDILGMFDGKNVNGVVYSKSLSGVENLHGVSSLTEHSVELDLIEDKCIVNLQEGVCYGGVSVPLLKMAEKYFRTDQHEEGKRILRSLNHLLIDRELSTNELRKLDKNFLKKVAMY